MTTRPLGATDTPRWPPRVAFSWHADARGRTATCSEEEHLRDLIEQVLLTAPGERVMRPGFGGGLLQRVFAPGGPELLAATEYLVQAALSEHLGQRIQVNRLELGFTDSTLLVVVDWTLLRTSTEHTSSVSVGGVS